MWMHQKMRGEVFYFRHKVEDYLQSTFYEKTV
jgi:hypothetical protein